MPVLRNRSVVEIARGLKAFVNLDVGLTRGPAPAPELAEARTLELRQAHETIEAQSRQLQQLRRRPEGSGRKAASPETPIGAPPAAPQAEPRAEPRPEDRLTVFRNVLALLPPGRLLDLACGHGKFSLIARDLGWEVTAVDVRTERMPDTPGIQWVQSDIRAFEIDPDKYDCISVLGLLYHLELPDQLDLLARCAGVTTILDTHVALKQDREERGYEGTLFEEVAGASEEQHAATATASWGNKLSFWPTEESLLRMIRDSGFASTFRMAPPHTPDRTFYLCFGRKGEKVEDPITGTRQARG